MINVNLICIGSLKEKYFVDAVNEYQKRLRTMCDFSIIQLDEQRLNDNPTQAQKEQALEKEAEKIISKIPKGSVVLPLCIEGKIYSSEDLAQKFSDYALYGKSSITFIIGSSFGLSERIKKIGDERISMSKMTFPHQLARVMLCEQIYRAFSINANSKYHK